MNINWKWKLAIVVAILVLIASLLLIIKWQRDIIKRQEQIENSLVEMKKLPDSITRAEAKYATTDDIKALAKDLNIKLDPIKEDLKTLGADVKAIQKIKIVSTGYSGGNLPSDSSEPRSPNEHIDVQNDPYGYQKNAQILKLNEPFSNNTNVPFGEVKFSAWREKPWDLNIHKRNYSVINVLGQDEDGRHYTYSKFSVEVDGKQYDLDVQENKLIEEYPKDKFSWNPRLYLSLDFGTNISYPQFDVSPNIQLGLFSHGKTKDSPTWTFLGLGGSYQINNESFGLIVSPVNYNVGEFLPLVRNLYVGPSLILDTKGEFLLMGGIRVGL